MSRYGRRSPLLRVLLSAAAALVAVTVPFHATRSFVPIASRSDAGMVTPSQRGFISLRAETQEAEIVRSAALVRLEEEIEQKMQAADEQHDNKRLTELARLLVLAKASEGAAAWQATEALRNTVGDSIAETLADFVGRKDYDIADVAGAVDSKVGAAVASLENVYLTAESAAAAPPGSNPIVLSDVMTPVVDEMAEGTKEAVSAFTGKEEYELGDITKEADKRAKAAIATLLGKEEYQFGDISRAAAAKAMDAVTSFTGKKDYQFGDVTKTLLRNALDFLDGDQKKE
mmetsp:Transcript_115610/g.326831  ORF Transcript_115610/g.326831 Transcript_115610/m.326831 type:complete len:287 (-) Transcript_115610:102-962(-)|eukprot:CAMPEP_0117558548 /NCGR_PEP_ID=MMETSP0784-20121206/52894_1 /TAXON_ID=39447 /ORGANISM="" /LENGTH=286 /DNA_ID=CAMNT_0005355883 /DNA_START=22 /DNA_END=882 /DNA_ORIENTATION=+